MKKLLVKILIAVLIVMLTITSFVFALMQTEPELQVEARTSADVDKDIKECEKLISGLNTELNTLKTKMNDMSSLTTTANQRAELVTNEIAVLEAEIELNESLLQSCDMKRATAQAEKELVQNEYEYYEGLFAELMRFVYENGNVTDFELIFSSSSLSDYLNRRDDFNSIMGCIEDLTDSISQSFAHLLDLDQQYDVAETKYKAYIQDLNAKKAELDESKKELDAIAAELGTGANELTAEYQSVSDTLTAAKNKLSSLRKEREVLYRQEQAKKQKTKEHTSYIASSKVSSSGFSWPLELGISYRISSYFSTRTNPITGSGTEFHQGLDIACAKGTRVLAAKGGVVTKAAWYGGYGNCVIIYHGKDSKGKSVTTLYGHASSLECKEGDQVDQGDVVSLVGTTGRSTGNHLHFSVLLDGVYVDPDDYLPDGYYTKMPNKK